MPETKIGGARVSSNGTTLTISHPDSPKTKIEFDPFATVELIEFVMANVGAEFNRRRSFRVPIHDTTGLIVEIQKDGNSYPAKPTDINLSGMFLQVHRDNWVTLAIEEEVQIFIEFNSVKETWKGVVRRADAYGYGIFFPSSMEGTQLNPIPLIGKIVTEMQRRWLTRRVQVSE